MVRLMLPFVLGLVAGDQMHAPILVLLFLLGVGTLAAYLLLRRTIEYKDRWWRGTLITIWLFLFGITWATIHSTQVHPRSIALHEGEEGPWLVRVITINRLNGTQLRADAQVVALHKEGGWLPRQGTIMLTALRSEDGSTPRIGDRLFVSAPLKRIARIADPGGFDRRLWAAARGIELELFATSRDWHLVDHTTTWVDRFSALRRTIGEWVDSAGLGPREQALVKALVLGQRDELDGEQRTAFARSGTIHVLAVSGMHVGLIYVIIRSFFSWAGGNRRIRILRSLFVLFVLWMYAGITGAAPSILRATIMFSLIAMGDIITRRTEHVNSLAAALLLLVLWDPSMLGNVGFQLSFLAVLGIIMFYKPILDLWTPKQRIMRHIWSLAVVSIAAQTLTTPVSLYYFNAFPVWFLPANIVVVSIVGISVWLSIALIMLHWLPWVNELLVWLLTILLKVVAAVTATFASMPLAYPALRVDQVMMFLLFMTILAMGALLIWRWRNTKWIAVASIVLLIMVWGYNAGSMNRTEAFIIYDERKGYLASMTKGRDMVMLVGQERPLDDAYILRKTEQHAKAWGLRRTLHVPLNSLKGDGTEKIAHTVIAAGRWASDAFDVLFLSDGSQEEDIKGLSGLDAVIFHDMEHIPDKLLEAAAGASACIILAGKNSWRSRAYVGRWCAQQAIPFHDVFAQGAFILEKEHRKVNRDRSA